LQRIRKTNVLENYSSC